MLVGTGIMKPEFPRRSHERAREEVSSVNRTAGLGSPHSLLHLASPGGLLRAWGVLG